MPRMLLRRWREARGGATAIEVAILALPFIVMVFGVIQLALYFMVQVTLDNATAVAARALRTGHDANGNVVIADGASDTTAKTAFANMLCSNMGWLQGQCPASLGFDVQTFSGAFGGTANQTGCFYSGSAGSVVELRTSFTSTLMTGFLSSSLPSGSTPGSSLVRATQVFQVEPNGQNNSSSTTC